MFKEDNENRLAALENRLTVLETHVRTFNSRLVAVAKSLVSLGQIVKGIKDVQTETVSTDGKDSKEVGEESSIAPSTDLSIGHSDSPSPDRVE